jgi:hypothetical protein
VIARSHANDQLPTDTYNHNGFLSASSSTMNTDAGHREKIRIHSPNCLDEGQSPGASSPGANDFNNNSDKIQSPAKKSKSNYKDKVKATLYDYKEEEINYNFAEENDISEKNSVFEYKNETESEININDEIEMNSAILDFSEISLDGYTVRALKKEF